MKIWESGAWEQRSVAAESPTVSAANTEQPAAAPDAGRDSSSGEVTALLTFDRTDAAARSGGPEGAGGPAGLRQPGEAPQASGIVAAQRHRHRDRESGPALPFRAAAQSRSGALALGVLLVVVIVLVVLLMPPGHAPGEHTAKFAGAVPTGAAQPAASGVVSVPGPSAAASARPTTARSVRPSVKGSALGTVSVTPGATQTPSPTPPDVPACGGRIPPAGVAVSASLFCDSFSGAALDTSKWNTYLASQGTGGQPWNGDTKGGSSQGCDYNADYFLPSQVTVGGGLNLTAMRQTYAARCNNAAFSYPWVSGVVSTYGHFEFAGGYAQFVMKAPVGGAFWPALWMVPGPGAASGTSDEIDVQEGGFLPAPTSQTFSYRLHHGGTAWGTSVNAGVDLTAGFHTYGLYWVPGQSVTWYLDGHQIAQVTSATFTIPTDPEILVMNLSVCTTAASSFHAAYDATTPNTAVMQVSSVGVWQ
jgi:beta-glucanase (GH16 family)